MIKKALILLAAIAIVLATGPVVWYLTHYTPSQGVPVGEEGPGRGQENQAYLASFFKGFSNQERDTGYDPEYIAEVETRMWKNYYRGRHGRVALDGFRLLRSQFGLSYKNALLAGKDLALAARAFAQTKDHYEKEVLPHLEKAYRRIDDALDEAWDPEAVARAELAWWVARRTEGQNDPVTVGALIAREYTLLHGVSNHDIERAGLMRAQAAFLRDEGEGEEKTVEWDRIQELLEESYRALVLGIGQ